MLEDIYITYVLLVGTAVVSLFFIIAFLVALANFWYELIKAAFQDLKSLVRGGLYLIKSLLIPLLRVWWIITRAPVRLFLIILNSIRFLLTATLRTLLRYWRTYIYIVEEDTMWDWQQSVVYYTNNTIRARLANSFTKYLSKVYPYKHMKVRYVYMLTFLWGYWIRWCSYLFYLGFYYFIHLLRKVLYLVWIKPYIVEMFLFFFYYLYRSLGWWINVAIYKCCWNIYVFIRRQLYYLMPNWLIADVIQECNLNWFEWNFEANISDEDDDTPEDLFMNNPSKKIIQAFYGALPITSAANIGGNFYSYLFLRHGLTIIFKYLVILPFCLLLTLSVSMALLLINGICSQLALMHKGWWQIYRYFLRQQYYIYHFIINIHSYSWYKLLIMPFKKCVIILLQGVWKVGILYMPKGVAKILSCILSICFYIIYSIVWCLYHSPGLLLGGLSFLFIWLYRWRILVLSLFLGYYWIYQQYSEIGDIFFGSLQSSLEQFLRNIYFYVPIDESTRFMASNKYEHIKFWGELHNINYTRLLTHYAHVWQPDLAYMGYYQLALAPEQQVPEGITSLAIKDWPIHYNVERGLKYYRRGLIERDQLQWNLWFLKFVEGTYIWDPAPYITYHWNNGNFTKEDFRQFFEFKHIARWYGTPVTDLFWFFQEDEMEKWENIVDGLPRYYLFEPNVLQEEPEYLPNSLWNWFYYDLIQTPYLVPFDLPVEGNKEGAPGYRPGFRPPPLFSMLSLTDPIEYSRLQARQKYGFPVLHAMNYMRILHEFNIGLRARRDELIRISTKLIREMHIWNEILSSNTEWQMRLFTIVNYPLKWFNIRFDLIRIGIYKYCVYTKTTFWLYYYYYEPKIRVYFYLSMFQKIFIIGPYKWLWFCWKVTNSVFPFPEITLNIVTWIVLAVVDFMTWCIVYSYQWLIAQPIFIQTIESAKMACLHFPTDLHYLITKWYRIADLANCFKNWCVEYLHTNAELGQPLGTGVYALADFTSKLWALTWLSILYNYLYYYLSLDEYWSYCLYKYQCYNWYWNHIIQGYLYLWEHSFYIIDGKFSWIKEVEYTRRARGTIDRRIIFDIFPDIKNIMAYGYVREMGPSTTRFSKHRSWLKEVMALITVNDIPMSFMNHIIFAIWKWWDLVCYIWHNLLINGQQYRVFAWHHTLIGGAPILMVWMHKIQCFIDDIYIYLQLPRRLNKYGLSYTTRGYDFVDELNLLYIVRRTNFGYTRTWKSLNMLTYLVLMVKYPNTWEHFTILNNSAVYKNANGLRAVASKLFANLGAWASGLYYLALIGLIFVSNNFRNLLFCTTGSYNYPAETHNREYEWQRGRSQSSSEFDWMLISKEMQPYMKFYVDLQNSVEVHMDYYTKLMVNNSQVPLEDYAQIRRILERHNILDKVHQYQAGFDHRHWYLGPMYMAYLLNPYYNYLHNNYAYSSNYFNKFMAYAQLRDSSFQHAGQGFSINRAYTELHPTYTYNHSYIQLHIKQLDKWYNNNFNLDKHLFDFKLPDWAWHKDGFNMRVFSTKNPADLTQQDNYIYEDEKENYIPWTIFGWFLAIPLCLVIKPLAGIGQWLQHSAKEEHAWAWHLSYYINNLWYHIYFMKYFYYLSGPWLPETKLLASLDTEESEDYWHYHHQSAFLREFFYSYEDQDPVNVYQLLYTNMDPLWSSSLEEMRLFVLFSIIIVLCTLLLAMFKKISKPETNLSQIYSDYLNQWDSVKYFLPIKYHFRKIYLWFWR